MQRNLSKLKLYNLLLNSLSLNQIEYGYLCPLLEQTGIYSGYSDIILIAHKLSNQMENVYFLDKKISISKKQCIFLKKYFKFLFFYKKSLQDNQIITNKLILHNIKKENCKEIILVCLIYILFYKIWKTKYWYPLLFKLAFNCQEFSIARYFIKKSQLEFQMITMLILVLNK